MKTFYNILFPGLVTLAFLTSCATGSTVTTADLNNTVWTGSAENSIPDHAAALEGFYLSPGGSLLSFQSGSTGEEWSLDGNRLFLKTHNTETLVKETTEYTLRNTDGVLSLYPGGNSVKMPLQGHAYTPESLTGIWTVVELIRTAPLQYPEDSEPFMEILSDENGIALQGFGGVNRFRGSLKTDDFTWKSGPLMRTLMAGPDLEFENQYMKVLDRADRYLTLGNRLYLYEDTELLAVFFRGEPGK